MTIDLRRQKKSPELRRVESVEVLLNEEEKALIVEKARKMGLPVSTFIRFRLLQN